jgi:DNA-directed RNA polymerase specialized sigma24 family protein
MRCLDRAQQRPLLMTVATRRSGPSTKLFRMVSRFPAWDVFERKEVLPLLAQRIAQLPLASKKLLAMYYYDNLPISGIAACFNLPACRIYEILTQTVGVLGKDLLNFISRNVT